MKTVINEKSLFKACVEWSNNCLKKYENGSKFVDLSKNVLKLLNMNESNLKLNENRENYKWMDIINKYIRYPLMNKKYFIDNAIEYLNVEETQSLLIHFCLPERNSSLNRKRIPFPANKKIDYEVINASTNLDNAKVLNTGSWYTHWPDTTKQNQWIILKFPEITGIGSISIKTRCYQPKDISLMVSKYYDKYDDSSWELYWDKTLSRNDNSRNELELKVEPNSTYIPLYIRSKYWKFNVINAFTDYERPDITYLGIKSYTPEEIWFVED